MNQAAKQAYLDKTAAQLKEWGARVEVMKAKMTKETASARIDFHNQVESWQKKESVLKEKMEELRTAGADGFELLKSGAQSAWNELNIIMKSLEEKKYELKH